MVASTLTSIVESSPRSSRSPKVTSYRLQPLWVGMLAIKWSIMYLDRILEFPKRKVTLISALVLSYACSDMDIQRFVLSPFVWSKKLTSLFLSSVNLVVETCHRLNRILTGQAKPLEFLCAFFSSCRIVKVLFHLLLDFPVKKKKESALTRSKSTKQSASTRTSSITRSRHDPPLPLLPSSTMEVLPSKPTPQ